jgi:hypothetical protein
MGRDNTVTTPSDTTFFTYSGAKAYNVLANVAVLAFRDDASSLIWLKAASRSL